MNEIESELKLTNTRKEFNLNGSIKKLKNTILNPKNKLIPSKKSSEFINQNNVKLKINKFGNSKKIPRKLNSSNKKKSKSGIKMNRTTSLDVVRQHKYSERFTKNNNLMLSRKDSKKLSESKYLIKIDFGEGSIEIFFNRCVFDNLSSIINKDSINIKVKFKFKNCSFTNSIDCFYISSNFSFYFENCLFEKNFKIFNIYSMNHHLEIKYSNFTNNKVCFMLNNKNKIKKIINIDNQNSNDKKYKILLFKNRFFYNSDLLIGKDYSFKIKIIKNYFVNNFGTLINAFSCFKIQIKQNHFENNFKNKNNNLSILKFGKYHIIS